MFCELSGHHFYRRDLEDLHDVLDAVGADGEQGRGERELEEGEGEAVVGGGEDGGGVLERGEGREEGDFELEFGEEGVLSREEFHGVRGGLLDFEGEIDGVFVTEREFLCFLEGVVVLD